MAPRVNMLLQILAFNDRLLSNPLSSGQIALWHALTCINNKCSWIEWFTAPSLTLEALCGLSRQGINKARNVLKQEGLIDFKSNGTKAPSYQMNILYLSTTSNSVQGSIQSSVQDSIQVGEQASIQGGVQDSSALIKQKENKQKENKQDNPQPAVRIYSFLEKNAFGRPFDNLMQDKIVSWLSDLQEKGLSLAEADTWMIEAVNDALVENARSFKYVEKIMVRRINANILTPDAIEGDRHRKSGNGYSNGYGKRNSEPKKLSWEFDLSNADWDEYAKMTDEQKKERGWWDDRSAKNS